MQNYEQIFSELGIEVPEYKKADLKKKLEENYKTVAEYTKMVEKKDEYKESLERVQGDLEKFKDVDVEDLKNQIATLTQDLQNEKTARQKDSERIEREKTVNELFGKVDEDGKKVYPFQNEITENYFRAAVVAELEKDSAKGKSIEDIFKTMITDENGKEKEGIFVNKAEASMARFTGPQKKKPNNGRRYSISEIMKMKNENPNLDISQLMTKGE